MTKPCHRRHWHLLDDVLGGGSLGAVVFVVGFGVVVVAAAVQVGKRIPMARKRDVVFRLLHNLHKVTQFVLRKNDRQN